MPAEKKKNWQRLRVDVDVDANDDDGGDADSDVVASTRAKEAAGKTKATQRKRKFCLPT